MPTKHSFIWIAEQDGVFLSINQERHTIFSATIRRFPLKLHKLTVVRQLLIITVITMHSEIMRLALTSRKILLLLILKLTVLLFSKMHRYIQVARLII